MSFFKVELFCLSIFNSCLKEFYYFYYYKIFMYKHKYLFNYRILQKIRNKLTSNKHDYNSGKECSFLILYISQELQWVHVLFCGLLIKFFMASWFWLWSEAHKCPFSACKMNTEEIHIGAFPLVLVKDVNITYTSFREAGLQITFVLLIGRCLGKNNFEVKSLYLGCVWLWWVYPVL